MTRLSLAAWCGTEPSSAVSHSCCEPHLCHTGCASWGENVRPVPLAVVRYICVTSVASLCRLSLWFGFSWGPHLFQQCYCGCGAVMVVLSYGEYLAWSSRQPLGGMSFGSTPRQCFPRSRSRETVPFESRVLFRERNLGSPWLLFVMCRFP